METEKLIERLRNAAGGPEGIKMCADAATALSTLQAENAKLRAELEKAKAEFEEERAAVVDVDKAILWLKDYVFEDSRKIYTNGSRLIPYFRVLQAFRDKAYNGLQEGRA